MNPPTPPPTDNRLRGMLWPVGFAVLFCALWWGTVEILPLRAKLAEGNYQANMIRFADYLHGKPPEMVLVGSSIAGRLLPEFFGEAGAEVANLGLDGSVPVTGLDVVLRRPDLPGVVWIETTLIHRPPGANDEALLAALENFSFRISGRLPLLSATLRPSSVLYTKLKMWRDRTAPGRTGTIPESAPAVPGAVPGPELEWTEDERAVIDGMAGRIGKLRAAGTRVAFVHIPSLHPVEYCHPGKFAVRAANEMGLPILDVAAELTRRGQSVLYSDGIHLVADSAALAARALLDLDAAESEREAP